MGQGSPHDGLGCESKCWDGFNFWFDRFTSCISVSEWGFEEGAWGVVFDTLSPWTKQVYGQVERQKMVIPGDKALDQVEKQKMVIPGDKALDKVQRQKMVIMGDKALDQVERQKMVIPWEKALDHLGNPQQVLVPPI